MIKKTTFYRRQKRYDFIFQKSLHQSNIKSPTVRNNYLIFGIPEKEGTKTKKVSSMANYSSSNISSKRNCLNPFFTFNSKQNRKNKVNSTTNNRFNYNNPNNQINIRLNVNSEIINNNFLRPSKDKNQSSFDSIIKKKDKQIEKLNNDLVQSYRVIKDLKRNFEFKMSTSLKSQFDYNNYCKEDNFSFVSSSVNFAERRGNKRYTSLDNENNQYINNFININKSQSLISSFKRNNDVCDKKSKLQKKYYSKSNSNSPFQTHSIFNSSNRKKAMKPKTTLNMNNNITNLIPLKEMIDMCDNLKRRTMNVFEKYLYALKRENNL